MEFLSTQWIEQKLDWLLSMAPQDAIMWIVLALVVVIFAIIITKGLALVAKNIADAWRAFFPQKP